jgi:glycosyltransferase involved in cell wall biosynthesis
MKWNWHATGMSLPVLARSGRKLSAWRRRVHGIAKELCDAPCEHPIRSDLPPGDFNMETNVNTVKVDLHCHSSWSNAPYSWFLRSAKAAECYTDPEKVHEIATSRGMTMVTLTDHDTIGGALELASHYDNVFLSEEVSGRFPEDGCVVHLITLHITEAQHAELQRLRRNIYELVAYLDQEKITYFWCHPLSQVNRRLTRSHLERCFLMFRTLELRNGTRDAAHEHELLRLTGRITPAILERWAERHPEVPFINRAAQYAFVGGSDDHGGMAVARAYTSFEGDNTAAALIDAIAAGRVEPRGQAAHSETLAHNCYGVAAGYFANSGQLGTRAPEPDQKPAASVSLLGTLARYRQLFEQTGAQLSVARLTREGHTDDYQSELRRGAEVAFVRGWRDIGDRAAGALSGGRAAEAADAVADILKAALLELPYVLAARYHARDRAEARRFSEELLYHGVATRMPRVAVLSDTVDDVNGVALGLRRVMAEARRHGFHFRLVGVGAGDRTEIDSDGLVRLPGIFTHRLADYPDYAWSIPHLPALLHFLVEEEIDLIQCSTPGPMGFAGLLAARLTGTPVIGQYHTDVPEYAARITGDPMVGAMVGSIVGWFFRNLDHVLVPSRFVADLVNGMGVAADRVHRIPRGIDLDLFSPRHRDPQGFAAHGFAGHPTLLYVGRVSREKGLDNLAAAFQQVHAALPEARLVVVGDGPYRATLEGLLPAGAAAFPGFLRGEALARAFASADLFVFPSETETFGNVVVEAQASGLPVVLSGRGAAHEQMRDGVTGLVAEARDPAAFAAAIVRVLRDDRLRGCMSEAAVELARRYRMDEAFRGTFREYARILAGDQRPTGPAPVPEQRTRAGASA